MRVFKYFIYFALLINTALAQASLTSDFDASLGYTSLNVDAGETFVASLEEVIIDFNYNLNYAGPNISFNINFSEIIKDSFSNLAYTRLGLGLKWYFFGFNGEQLIIDNSTKGLVLRPTPFIGINGSLTNLSITTESFIGDFNTSNYEVSAVLGLEVPITSTFLFLGQVQGITSLSSNSDIAKNIGYNGFSILLGVKISRF